MAFLSTKTFPTLPSLRRLTLAAGFTALALLFVSLVFFYGYRDDCATVASWKFCQLSRHLVERALGIFMLGGFFAAARPAWLAPVLHGPSEAPPIRLVAALSFAGVVLVGMPFWIVGTGSESTALLAAVTSWAAGTFALAAAALRIVAPFSDLGRALVRGGPVLWGLLALGMFLPEIGDTLFPLWHMESVKDATFVAVAQASTLIGLDLSIDPAEYAMGQGDFFVIVGQSCSGIEGFALLTVFLGGYTALFWRDLRPARVALILPLALLLSWALNVVRISLLIWIGVNVSPVLAVEGFHSNAGWLMFSLLSLGIAACVHNVAWFRRSSAGAVAGAAPGTGTTAAPAALPPLLDDWNAARILPFAAFMATALLASTFVQVPALGYPARFVAVAAVLFLFRRHLTALPWRAAPAALLSGAAIGIAWIATAAPVEAGPLDAVLAGLAPGLLVLWVVTRVLGTTLLVPVIEELFFRSYLLERLGAGRSVAWTLVAIAVSTAIFAVLHDRWLAAALAGLVFAALALRPGGRLADAIVSHMVANGIIAAWALMHGDWSVI